MKKTRAFSSLAAIMLTGCANQQYLLQRDASSATPSVTVTRNVQPVSPDAYAQAPEVVRYDRYLLVSTDPVSVQRDPLSQIIDIRIPASVKPTRALLVNNTEQNFWNWLTTGFRNGAIQVNKPDSRAHIISGFVFLCVPEIFHLYIRQQKKDRAERNTIQNSFEKMGKHRINQAQRFFIAKLYSAPGNVGSYRPINGYLVNVNSLYGESTAPDNSQLITIT